MNQVNSPFLADISTLKSKSRNTRKKIYKYLQSDHHQKRHKENIMNIKDLLLKRALAQEIFMNSQRVELKNASSLDNMIFKSGVDLERMRTIVHQQEREVSSIMNHRSPVFRTAQKRKPLGDITQYQTADRKRLFLTTENEESARLSLNGDFCSDISIFKGLDDLPQQKSSDQFESVKLKENASLLQMENRCSNVSNNSLFDDPIQAQFLNFI